MTDRPMPAMYSSLRVAQPFADMSLRAVEGEEGVEVSIADGEVVGMLLPDVRMLKRLVEICEKAGRHATLTAPARGHAMARRHNEVTPAGKRVASRQLRNPLLP